PRPRSSTGRRRSSRMRVGMPGVRCWLSSTARLERKASRLKRRAPEWDAEEPAGVDRLQDPVFLSLRDRSRFHRRIKDALSGLPGGGSDGRVIDALSRLEITQ